MRAHAFIEQGSYICGAVCIDVGDVEIYRKTFSSRKQKLKIPDGCELEIPTTNYVIHTKCCIEFM